jgi:hypothetical protein
MCPLPPNYEACSPGPPTCKGTPVPTPKPTPAPTPVPPTPARSWKGLESLCAGSGTFTLDSTFDISDCDSAIHLSSNQIITIIGNGAVLDTNGKQSNFFQVLTGSLTRWTR